MKLSHSPLRVAIALGLLLAATPAVAESARYKIDPEHFSVGFLVDHLGYGSVLGMFRKAEGSFAYDEKARTLSDIRIVIKTDSVFTNHRKRDEHLRSPDFLNSKEFSELVFTADGGDAISERVGKVTGQLALLGQTHPVTIEVTLNKAAEYPIGSTFGGKPHVVGISARGSFKRSAYGMMYAVKNGWVGDDVNLIIEFEARRQ